MYYKVRKPRMRFACSGKDEIQAFVFTRDLPVFGGKDEIQTFLFLLIFPLTRIRASFS